MTPHGRSTICHFAREGATPITPCARITLLCRLMLAQGVIRGPLMGAARQNMMKHDEMV